MAKTRIDRGGRHQGRARGVRPAGSRARKDPRRRLELLTGQLAASVKALRRAQLMARLAHVITGPEGEFESWSDTLPDLVGIAPGAMPTSTREWLELLHPEDRELFRALCIDAGATHQRHDAAYRMRGRAGAWVHLRHTMEPLEDSAYGAGRWFSTLQDVTEENANLERLGTMARRLATLQEKERRDIARELHDRVGQNLAALGINLAQLREGFATPPRREAQISDCISLVEATGRAIQNVLTELKPPMLAGYGLIDALRFYAQDFCRRTGLAVTARGPEPALRLEAEIEMALFRIAQAALGNVAQHARARNVRITLRADGSRVRLEVSDDGIGFDVATALASGRWGLAAMRERTEAIGGTFEIDSAPGRGTRIAVELDAA